MSFTQSRNAPMPSGTRSTDTRSVYFDAVDADMPKLPHAIPNTLACVTYTTQTRRLCSIRGASRYYVHGQASLVNHLEDACGHDTLIA
jgi:hypothetical protein